MKIYFIMLENTEQIKKSKHIYFIFQDLMLLIKIFIGYVKIIRVLLVLD